MSLATYMDDPVLASDDDADGNEKQFQQLHEAISQLDNAKRIRPAKRKELTPLISEYHVKQNSAKLHAKDLASVLEKKKLRDTKLNKKAKKVTSNLKTLPKPVEKPTADLIKRKIGFEIVKEQLSAWDAVVESHHVADIMQFPLNAPKFTVQDGKEFFSKFSNQTELQKELNAVLHGSQQGADEEDKDEFPLTLEEIIERRKELAGIRARQSYREAKAFRQSKIKSKKYHRLQKKEKIRQQLKDFEVLQKTDPEAALKKLEELEKTRALERATLKHRSTGKWAQNLAVRAKYDQESRKVLAEQLAISREATQKVKNGDSSDEDDENELDPTILKEAIEISSNNPWSLEVSSDVNSFISGFRKYWSEKNKSSNDGKETEGEAAPESPAKNERTKTSCRKRPQLGFKAEDVDKNNCPTPTKKKAPTDKWVVTPVKKDQPTKPNTTNFDIDEAFYLADEKLAKNISEKFKTLKDKIKPAPKRFKVSAKPTKSKPKTPDLKMKKSRWAVERAEVDEELVDSRVEEVREVAGDSPKIAEPSFERKAASVNIDPTNFLKVKKTALNTPLGDEITGAEEDALDDDEQKQLIMEAFADDNVADFNEEKAAAEAETKVPEVAQELPGWGSWGGVGINPSKRRKKRRFMKIPELPARKDQAKPDVIINENPNPKIKDHMVKEVPFPFTSVDAFEANIRTPVSRDWVPELAQRQIVKPSVVIKQGTIIEPLSDDVLIRNKPKPRSLFKAKIKQNS